MDEAFSQVHAFQKHPFLWAYLKQFKWPLPAAFAHVHTFQGQPCVAMQK
jgi:hypothetical protein